MPRFRRRDAHSRRPHHGLRIGLTETYAAAGRAPDILDPASAPA